MLAFFFFFALFSHGERTESTCALMKRERDRYKGLRIWGSRKMMYKRGRPFSFPQLLSFFFFLEILSEIERERFF